MSFDCYGIIFIPHFKFIKYPCLCLNSPVLISISVYKIQFEFGYIGYF